MTQLFGGVEAGGTKIVCAVGSGAEDIRAQTQFQTVTPQETIPQIIEFFLIAQKLHGSLAAIGISSFGPLDLQPNSSTYGYITSTTKSGWAGTDFITPIKEALSIPVAIDTDVNGAALGEYCWGAAQGLDTFVYLTIGTGIGGGGLVNGKVIHGMLHPEMGHIYVPHDWHNDPFQGVCPFHGDCLEGLASGLSIEKRWGRSPETLSSDHPAWKLEAHYLAFGLISVIYILSPQRIILGGGVMKQEQLFPTIRANVQKLLNRYIQSYKILEAMDDYIVPPALGAQSGVLGAIALAREAIA